MNTEQGLVERIEAIRNNIDTFHPDMRTAARSIFEAQEQFWKLLPEILSALSPQSDRIRELEVPTPEMIEAGGLVFGEKHASSCYPQAMDFESNLAAEAIYRAMRNAALHTKGGQ